MTVSAQLLGALLFGDFKYLSSEEKTASLRHNTLISSLSFYRFSNRVTFTSIQPPITDVDVLSRNTKTYLDSQDYFLLSQKNACNLTKILLQLQRRNWRFNSLLLLWRILIAYFNFFGTNWGFEFMFSCRCRSSCRYQRLPTS